MIHFVWSIRLNAFRFRIVLGNLYAYMYILTMHGLRAALRAIPEHKI